MNENNKLKSNTDDMKVLLEATLKILKNRSFKYNNPELIFLSLFVETIVVSSINKRLEGSKSENEQYEFIKKNFGTAKLAIQEAVATAFQRPMRRVSGSDMEYYCTIKPVGNAISTMVH